MKKIILALLLIIIAVVAIVYFNLGYIVKKAVNKYGSEITGTEVSLQGFDLSLSKGEASASKLLVGNPKGYQAQSIFELENIEVNLDIKSLTSDTIVINSIVVNKPVITFEALSLQQNNIKALQDNINKNLPQTQKTESIAKGSDDNAKSAKKILIKKFVLSKATAQMYLPNINPQSVELPEIVITDFDGNPQKQIAKIFDAIIENTTKSVSNIAKQELENVAKENLNKITDSIKDKIDLKGLF